MSREIKLCDKWGTESVTVTDVEVGYEYELLTPVKLIDKSTGQIKETITIVKFEKEPTRNNQREWVELKLDDIIDSMIPELTNLKHAHVGFLTVKDISNIEKLFRFFLPEGLLKEIEG